MSTHTPLEPAETEEASNQELLDAFLRGAGLGNNTIGLGAGSKLTPELMEMLGKLLAASVHGAHGLLARRTQVKREVNADMTMVVRRNNNPLKFLQDSDTIMLQMLRKKMPGFMDPVSAMQEAFLDMHAHQSALVAGMQAALLDMMERYNPEHVIQQTPPEGTLENMFPAKRKARMWDKQVERFQIVRREVLQESQAPFGNAFLSGYEAEITRCEDEADGDK
ncbi:type VI secretion system-associated FHA domain protein TagH [Undibacterium sp. TJN25]|uniref:type VI secretion system-associated FHA domain protein TagH n=1 Tax=Undibacterium sp. TJN25 TaxID=3413056 RepID=UPI003BEFB123